jgi:hypothetical protein
MRREVSAKTVRSFGIARDFADHRIFFELMASLLPERSADSGQFKECALTLGIQSKGDGDPMLSYANTRQLRRDLVGVRSGSEACCCRPILDAEFQENPLE